MEEGNVSSSPRNENAAIYTPFKAIDLLGPPSIQLSDSIEFKDSKSEIENEHYVPLVSIILKFF